MGDAAILLLLAGLAPNYVRQRREAEGNRRCPHFKDDTSSPLTFMLQRRRMDGWLQEYLQLLKDSKFKGVATQTTNTGVCQ